MAVQHPSLYDYIYSVSVTEIKKLIRKGIDVNNPSPHEYRGPILIYCIQSGASDEIIKLLIDAGAEINAQNMSGDTVLFWAVTNRPNLVPMLINAGADVNIQNIHGSTALMVATYSDLGNSIIESLINAGAIIDTRDLANAVYNGNAVIAKLLLKHGANPNGRDDEGYTPLMVALGRGNIEIVQLLLEYGADINAVNNEGMSILMAAILNYNEASTIDMLLKRGADKYLRDNAGHDVFWYLAKRKSAYQFKIWKNSDIFDNNEEYFKYALYVGDYDIISDEVYNLLPEDDVLTQSEYNQLIRSKRLEDKLKLIFAKNASKQTLLYLSSDKEVGWVAKDRYKELRSKLGRRYYSSDSANEYLVHSALTGDLDEVKYALKNGGSLKLFGEHIVDFVRAIKNYSVKYYIIDLIFRDEYTYNLVKNMYIKELTKDTGNSEFITLYRAMEVDDGYLEHLKKQGKHLGIYWTYNKEQAYSHWGQGKKNEIIFTVRVSRKNINLGNSIFLYLDEFYNEKEIRLFKGTPLNIISLELNGESINLSVLNNRQLYAGFSKHSIGRRY